MSALLQKIVKIVLSIAFTLAIISSVVKFTLNFKPLYYFDINYLNIEKLSNMNKKDIKSNYNYLIEYIGSNDKVEFKLPTLPSSESGIIHFEEVKDIFKALDTVLIVSIVIIFVCLFINYKDIYVLKYVSNILISIPLILSLGLAISFDYSFILFHKILFRNGYWEFYPDQDPIINMLPQEFFMHSALLILFLMIFIGTILKLLFRKINAIKTSYSIQSFNTP